MSRGWVRSIGAGALCAPLLLLSHPAGAVESGFYVGGNFGTLKTKLDIGIFDGFAQAIYANAEPPFIVSDDSSSLDVASQTYSLLAGYRFSRHFAVEGAVMDFDKSVYREQSTGIFVFDDGFVSDPETHAQKWTVSSRGMSVSGLGILPLTYRAELYARASFLYVQNSLHATVDQFTLGDLSDSNSTWMAGVGASYTFADIYAVRLEYQRAFDIGESHLPKSDYDIFTIGVAVTF